MRDKHGIGQAIVMITQLSINMLVPVFMCLFIGIWLDKRLGTGWLTLVFLILGIMASIRSMFITLKPLLKGEREKKDEALADLILGILIFGILVVFVGLFVAPDKAAFVLGAVLGTATSVIRAVHMAVTLDRQLDYGEKDARAYAARNYGIRYLIMIAVLLVSTRLGVSGMAGAVIGLFSMKPAAILSPQIHKYIYTRIFGKGR